STLVNRSAAKLERRVRRERNNAQDGQTEVPRSAAYAPPFPPSQEGDRQRRASASRCLSLAEAHLRAAGRRCDPAHADDGDGFGTRREADREVGGSWKAPCRQGEGCRRQARCVRQSWIQIPWPREGCGRRSPRGRVGVLING